jgi:5-methylcytosine-specific restriction endonuclease McrA
VKQRAKQREARFGGPSLYCKMIRPNCIVCGKPAESGGMRRSSGKKTYKKYCSVCHRHKKQSGEHYFKYKKSVCEFCGFIPVNACQLDVDHKDGDKRNNSPDNLQTLCANCHRLKTFINRDSLEIGNIDEPILLKMMNGYGDNGAHRPTAKEL